MGLSIHSRGNPGPGDGPGDGHRHGPVSTTRDGVLFVNGGEGYPSFVVPGTIAWLTGEDGVPSVEIVEIAPAE